MKREIYTIRADADEYIDLSEDVKNLIEISESLNPEMVSFCEKNVAKGFINEWEKLKPSLNQLVELLEEISHELEGVAANIEESLEKN